MVPDALLTLLRWSLIGLLYLFFFRVLQVTWKGSHAQGSAPGAAPRRRGSRVPHVVILEPPELSGLEYAVTSDLTFGRSPDCSVPLEDNYISGFHLRVSPNENGVVVEDLGSTNGTYFNAQPLLEPATGAPGDRLQIGGIVMELR